MRWLRGLLALLAILVVALGAPILLLGWGRLVGPAGWRGDDGSLLLAILTLAGWLAWLVFTLATAAEVVRYASGNRFVVNLPLLGGLQAACAGLVLAVVALAANSQAPAQPATAPTPAANSAPVRVEPRPEPPPPAGATPVTAAEDDRPRYAVAVGDDLWTIAERVLGEGRRWRELQRANPDLLADPTRQLTPGARLALPADATPPRAARPEPAPQRTADRETPDTITVERGDTLSGLALEHLGKAGRWPRIAAANDDLIEDPDHIEVGWVLTLPDRPVRTGAHRPRGDAPSEPPPQSSGPDATPPGETPSKTHDPLPRPAPRLDELPRPRSGDVSLPRSESTPTTEPAQDPPAQPDDRRDQPGSEHVPGSDVLLLGGLSALAAAGLMGGWQARRLLQSRVRQPGRRVAQPSDDLARFHSALGRRQLPDHIATLDAALRAIGRHHHQFALPLPALAQVTVTPDRLLFQWAEPAGDPPDGFTGDRTAWLLDRTTDRPAALVADDHPCAFPALVSLGTAPGGEIVLVDVERPGVLGIAADNRELQVASLASVAVELACAPWAAELSLVVIGKDGALARTAGGETVTWLPDHTAALARLRRRHQERSRALAGRELRRLRTDPETAEAVAPEVYVFHDPLPAQVHDEVDRLLSGSRLGLAAVVCATEPAGAAWTLFGDPLQPSGRLHDTPVLAAHAIPEATRSAVESLYRVAESTRTDPAPWWPETDETNLLPLPARAHPSEDDVEIVSLRPRERTHPTLLLLGPVDLIGAAGPEPARSRSQLIEMASWILEFPGRTASQMAAGLGIAETTRRSNMSRLRSWLGSDPAGEQYLPDAYSGRIRLHPDVTSDLGHLRLLTGPGVNRTGDTGLVAALELVRGELLADAAPGQWFWAETLRSDVAALLRDAGLVLVDRSLASGNLDLARWAAERALVVCPEDELLICARIRTEHAAGNRAAVERFVLRLSQQARALGVDLLPETVMLCQQVMEGRTRARRA